MKPSPALRQLLVYVVSFLVSAGVLIGIIPHDKADHVTNLVVDSSFAVLMISSTILYLHKLFEMEKHHFDRFLHKGGDLTHGRG